MGDMLETTKKYEEQVFRDNGSLNKKIDWLISSGQLKGKRRVELESLVSNLSKLTSESKVFFVNHYKELEVDTRNSPGWNVSSKKKKLGPGYKVMSYEKKVEMLYSRIHRIVKKMMY